MEHFWLILVLIAQFAWACAIYIDKYLLRTTSSPETGDSDSVGTLVLISALFTGIVALLILCIIFGLYGYDGGVERITFRLGSFLAALCVGIIEIVWLIPYLYALDYADEMVAPPLLQTIPIFGFFLGFFVFGEIPTTAHLIAGIVILAGSLILNMELVNEERGKGTIHINWKGIALMLFSSFLVALAGFVFKDAALEENYWGSAFWTAMSSFATGLLIWAIVPAYRKQFNTFWTRKRYRAIALNTGNEIIDNIAVFVYYAAIVYGPSTALIQSTVAYQPVLLLAIAFVLGFFGSHEHQKALSGGNLTRRVAGISIIFFGSILIFR